MSALLLLLALLFAPFAAAVEPAAADAAPDPSTANPAPASPNSYSAGGTEPFWGLGIANGRLVFDLNETEIVYSSPAPARETTPNGFIYRTARLIAEIRHEECNDGMSDAIYADNVVVTIDGRRLEGCGGAIIPLGPLDDTQWKISEIAGQRMEDELADLYSIGFNRWSGVDLFTVCGAFTGPYTIEGDVLTLHLAHYYGNGRPPDRLTNDFVRDPADCTQPYRDHERRMLQILIRPVRIRLPTKGSAIFAGENGTLALRAQ